VFKTVCESGSEPGVIAYNMLVYMRNQNWGMVLAEPFPWTVTQGVILVLVISNSQLESVEIDLPTQTTQLEP